MFLGLFICLLATIVLCFGLMGFEHFIYHYFIPHAKKKPADSWYKGTTLMFISQVGDHVSLLRLL